MFVTHMTENLCYLGKDILADISWLIELCHCERHSGRYLLLQFYHLVTGIQADILDAFSSSSAQHANRIVVSASVSFLNLL